MSTLSRTPLHGAHVRLGARIVPFAGFEMPVQYSSIREEHEAVRERAGLFDVSHMGQIHLAGAGANEAVERLVTCEIDSLRTDRARYGLMPNETGGCVDDVLVTRLAEDELFLCVNASNLEKDEAWIREQTGPGVQVTNRSAETALLALQGPAAARILSALLPEDATLPRRFRVARMEIAGLSTLVSGTGYTGSPGFEIYLEAAHAEALFEAILEAGRSEGIRPAGLGARDTLRLEAALPLYGHELDDTTSPVEAGLERFVKRQRGGFIGAKALAERDDEGPDSRRLIGFEMTGRGIARADYEILNEGRVVGRVTSGAPSPTLGKSIGLGYAPRRLGEVGQVLAIRIRKKDVEARVVELPFLR
ncbi:MAG: glycine cleavage system aminomethyltransferase GcvT [bacterium]